MAWFSFLAFSDSDRPSWLRVCYAATALVFAVGTAAELVIAGRRRRRAKQGN
ncbi:hypothetical protein [Streptomyces halobius]|uniref:Uncharacterized protein n=1 Tax=Streptomyces halobius TaxID=2879846 RepID=A0ABY4M8M4_9ACTN|nr:hypothetical protein [Streptomyces halobius]UQA93119.1 hypothetical protein K9S39_15840 [Streptomyces halobius]